MVTLLSSHSPNFIMVYGIWRPHKGTRDLNRLQTDTPAIQTQRPHH